VAGSVRPAAWPGAGRRGRRAPPLPSGHPTPVPPRTHVKLFPAPGPPTSHRGPSRVEGNEPASGICSGAEVGRRVGASLEASQGSLVPSRTGKAAPGLLTGSEEVRRKSARDRCSGRGKKKRGREVGSRAPQAAGGPPRPGTGRVSMTADPPFGRTRVGRRAVAIQFAGGGPQGILGGKNGGPQLIIMGEESRAQGGHSEGLLTREEDDRLKADSSGRFVSGLTDHQACRRGPPACRSGGGCPWRIADGKRRSCRRS